MADEKIRVHLGVVQPAADDLGIRPVEFRLINGEWKLYLDNTNRWPLRQY